MKFNFCDIIILSDILTDKSEFIGGYEMENIIDKLYKLFENGVSDDFDREILAQSLFYYCCGKDPTPIISFGSDYLLYIYSDIIDYGLGDFKTETEELYNRLDHAGYKILDIRDLTKSKRWKDVGNVILTQWLTPQKTTLFLIYIQNDAVETFKKIYHDNSNYIQPKCICNYRCEFSEQQSYDFFNTIEKRTEYILGYCENHKYKLIGEYMYQGDYECGTKVKLFHRLFWYVY